MFTNSLRLCSLRSVKFSERTITKAVALKNGDPLSINQQIQPNDGQKYNNSKWTRLVQHNNSKALSTIQPKTHQPLQIASKDESREFMAIFPDIVRDLTEAGRHTDIPEVTKWYAKVLQYNVPNGKKNRGLSVVAAYKTLADPELLTPENIKLANVLGWCVEMLQAFFLVIDDIMDRSEMRRGTLCWYKASGTGLNAFNDSILIENGIYSILKKYLSNHHSYIPVIELFHDVTLKTCMGQALDSFSSENGKPNLDLFTMNRYNSIVKYKTAYYTFQLPVLLAMYLAGNYDEELHRQAKTILLEMGHFFQVQDDFLDCFGKVELTGKKQNDIREGKCTWLVVVALQRATPEQRMIIRDNYGVDDPQAIETIRNMYEVLGLPNTYYVYEEENYNLIKTHIQQISKGLPHNLFFKYMERLYKRES